MPQQVNESENIFKKGQIQIATHKDLLTWLRVYNDLYYDLNNGIIKISNIQYGLYYFLSIEMSAISYYQTMPEIKYFEIHQAVDIFNFLQ